MLVGIVSVSLLMHYALVVLDMLPDASHAQAPGDRSFFKVNYQLVLNAVFIVFSAVLVWFWRQAQQAAAGHDHHEHHDHDHGGGSASLTDKVLSILVVVALIWLAGGLLVTLFAGG